MSPVIRLVLRRRFRPAFRIPAWSRLGVAVAGALLVAAPPSASAHRSDLEPPLAFGREAYGLNANRPPHIFTHNVGLLNLQITNLGIIGNPFVLDLISAGWRGGEYLFYSGLWIGAIGSDSEPHVSTANQLELRPDLSPVWTIYRSYEGVKNGNRLGEGGFCTADDDHDGCSGETVLDAGLIDEDFQNGLDDDGDGRIDEDFESIGQQMFSCMYRDDTPEAVAQVADHVPLGILVRQRSFEWSTATINEFVGFDFQIINTGDQRLKNVYLGFFSDSDIGPKSTPNFWTDDLVGWAHIDTTVTDALRPGACSVFDLSMDTAYMWDAKDDGTTISGGDVPGVFGTLFLGHTTDDSGIKAPQNVGLTTVVWFSSSGQNSDPQNDDERYALLASGNKPQRNAVKPDDYRYVVAAGPFQQLNPGESLNFQTAYVIGEGQDGFRANAVNAQRVFNGRFVDGDRDPSTGINGKERCIHALDGNSVVQWDDPCDTLQTQITFKGTRCNWVDADCDPCTGVQGQETAIKWVGTTAPPPPNLNTDPNLDPIRDPNLRAFQPAAGDHGILLQWDNSPELRKDPITGQNLFEGYRVWRADNWQRPEGSIGPSPEEWMKIAEFRKDASANSQGAQSLHAIENRDVAAVGQTDDGKPVYPIGRYEYADSSGIVNGKVFFYSVTAFGVTTRRNPDTGVEEEVVLDGQPSAVEAEAVVPRWNAARGCDDVKVVPNPYRGGADWDLVPSDKDPTGTKIAFRNLPQAESTIRIYTLAGDLVIESVHDGTGGDGTYFWNMITRNGQNVTSGLYLYSVEYPGGICRGRFAIIR